MAEIPIGLGADGHVRSMLLSAEDREQSEESGEGRHDGNKISFELRGMIDLMVWRSGAASISTAHCSRRTVVERILTIYANCGAPLAVLIGY